MLLRIPNSQVENSQENVAQMYKHKRGTRADDQPGYGLVLTTFRATGEIRTLQQLEPILKPSNTTTVCIKTAFL